MNKKYTLPNDLIVLISGVPGVGKDFLLQSRIHSVLYSFLHCSIVFQNSYKRLEYYLYIPLNTPLPNILGIQLYHFLKVRDITPSTYLPQSGQSRPE